MKVQVLQSGDVAQCRRDGTSQLVVGKVQARQIGELAQLSWDAARQLVVVKAQVGQSGDVAQCRRDAAQSVILEVQAGHPTGGDREAAPPVYPPCCTPIQLISGV